MGSDLVRKSSFAIADTVRPLFSSQREDSVPITTRE